MVTKEMIIGEVLSVYPGTFDIFMKHGLHCVGCGGALFETIAEGAMAHGIDIEVLINDLNKYIADNK